MLKNDSVKLSMRVKQITTKDGRKFDAYETIGKNGVRVTVKFRKEVKNLPTENSYILVPIGKMNLATNTIYPTIWIHEVTSVIPFESEKQVDKNLFEILDINDEEEPF